VFGRADASRARYGCEHRLPLLVRIEAWRSNHAQYIDRTKLCDLCADLRTPDISLLQRLLDALFQLTQRKVDCVNVTDDWQSEIATLIDS